MVNKHLNEVHGELTIVAPSTKRANGYLYYYWCKCSCGNFKRLRYDQVRKNKSCGMCEDFNDSGVLDYLKELERGKEKE